MNNNLNDIFILCREHDTIELDEMLNILQMKKRIRQTKALHSYEIDYTEKSGYFTVVDDDTALTGKKKSANAAKKGYGMHLQNGTLTIQTET